MSLYDRFELLGLDRDDGVKTFEAREISTGRAVQVHLFVQAAAPLQAALLKAIERLPESQRGRIIDRGKHEGTPYVVTDRLADYGGLSEWVQAAGHEGKAKKTALETAGAWKLPPKAPPPAAAPPSSLNQQFSELFATGERPVLPAETLILPPKAAAPPPAKQPGEFTRMFQSPVAAKPDAPPAPVPAAAPTPPPAKEPGEFTRMFQSPVAAKPDAPPPAAPPSKQPGEFTRMFQSPAAAAPPAPPAPSGPSDFDRFFESPAPTGPMPQSPAVNQPLAPRASGSNAGEFTRTFGKVDMPAPPPAAPAPPAKEPGEFTRMFQSPGAPAAPPPSAPLTAPAPPPYAPVAPPAISKPAGPGEYTRQFSAPAALTLGQTGQAGAPPPAPAFATQPAMTAPAPPPARKSNLPLVLGLAGIAVVAILVVIFFALRPK